MDAVFGDVSVATTLQKTLDELGIIFCSFNEQDHDDHARRQAPRLRPASVDVPERYSDVDRRTAQWPGNA